MMAPPIEKWSKVEVRAVIRFLHAKGLKPCEIHSEIQAIYGENVLGHSQVYHWCTLFKDGHTDLEDKLGRGHPFSSKTKETVDRVDELIQSDRRLKVREIAESLDLSKSSIHRIVFDELGYRKVCARWVPKQLTADHKTNRVDACQNLLRRCRDRAQRDVLPNAAGDLQEPADDFLGHIVTGDETWLHHSTPETKRD